MYLYIHYNRGEPHNCDYNIYICSNYLWRYDRLTPAPYPAAANFIIHSRKYLNFLLINIYYLLLVGESAQAAA